MFGCSVEGSPGKFTRAKLNSNDYSTIKINCVELQYCGRRGGVVVRSRTPDREVRARALAG